MKTCSTEFSNFKEHNAKIHERKVVAKNVRTSRLICNWIVCPMWKLTGR